MNFSDVFIRRPVGTILISIGILLVGIVAYRQLPVASLPSVDIPTIRVSASRPRRTRSNKPPAETCHGIATIARSPFCDRC